MIIINLIIFSRPEENRFKLCKFGLGWAGLGLELNSTGDVF